jgi:hypothetical protein
MVHRIDKTKKLKQYNNSMVHIVLYTSEEEYLCEGLPAFDNSTYPN